jgi:hypothetical protein
MPGLSEELYNRCRNTLLQCSEFDTDAAVRAVFVTDELRPFRDRLPSAGSRSERIDACLAFLADQRLRDSRAVLPLFLAALRDRYQEGDALRDELGALVKDVRQSLGVSGPVPPVPPPPPPGCNMLFRHPIVGVAAGIIVVVITTILFFRPLRCVLEFRLTEATVALIALLALGAGIPFKIVPSQARDSLRNVYGGFAAACIIIVLVMVFLPSPSPEECFDTLTHTPTLIPTSTPTFTLTPTLTPTSTHTPTLTPILPCATPHPTIAGLNLSGVVTITKPVGDCVPVGRDEIIAVSWDGSPTNVTMWILVYAPRAGEGRYYPRRCGENTLSSSGNRQCNVTFARPEPYEVIVVLADQAADDALQNIATLGNGAAHAELPRGIAEKASLSVVRTE